MDTSAHFHTVKLPTSLINLFIEELSTANWYTSRYGQCRSDVSTNLRTIVENTMPFKVSCCGFFKNDPGRRYNIHKDSQRQAAVNILLVDDCSDFHVYSYSDNMRDKISVPYQKYIPILLNTKKFHSVQNLSSVTRYLVSIGCDTESYESIRNKFQ